VAKEFVHDKERKLVIITDGDCELVLSEDDFRKVNRVGQSGLLMGLKKKKADATGSP